MQMPPEVVCGYNEVRSSRTGRPETSANPKAYNSISLESTNRIAEGTLSTANLNGLAGFQTQAGFI